MENEKSIRNPVNKPIQQYFQGQEKRVKILFVCHGNITRYSYKAYK